jgi:hypothetical protein
MWRTFFASIGFFLIILGVECLAVDEVRVKSKPPIVAFFETEAEKEPPKVLTPPPWAPWSLISAGVVTVLYSYRVMGG